MAQELWQIRTALSRRQCFTPLTGAYIVSVLCEDQGDWLVVGLECMEHGKTATEHYADDKTRWLLPAGEMVQTDLS